MFSTSRYARFVAVLVCTSVSALAVDYGRTPGSFAVSDGTARYTIPIWTPPGPNGIAPSIALTYDSDSGNGIGGVGWHLATASSSIARCRRTKGQDGEAGAVDLTMNDRFCISGNRLRLGSGTYGAPGSVYYTEIADYSRITAYGVAGNGPDHFIVEAKSGLKYEYGNVSSARVYPGVWPTISSTVQRWMLNKVSDRDGNNYIVTYNNQNGFAFPDVISWTPTSWGALTYRYEAKFNYTNNRADIDSYFGKVAGFDVLSRIRLENIQIKSAGSVVRKYVFSYGTSTTTFRSRLANVKECADDSGTNCLLPITFAYQTGTADLTPGTAPAPNGSSNGIFKGRYDFNGDGKDDILWNRGGLLFASFSTNAGYTVEFNTGVSTSTPNVLIDRFLPDGRDAILVPGNPMTIVSWDSGAISFVTTNTGINLTSTAIAADYDGDKLADIVHVSADKACLVVRRNISSTASPGVSFSATTFNTECLLATSRWNSVSTKAASGIRRADFNGDGRQDVYGVFEVQVGSPPVWQGGHLALLAGHPSGFDAMAGPVGDGGVNFNGDNCTDQWSASGSILISPCSGGAGSSIASPAVPLYVLDWNGDEKTDILVNNGGTFGVYLSTGASFSALIPTSTSANGTFFPVDLDGDDLDDLIKLNGLGTISYATHMPLGQVPVDAAAIHIPDLLSNATDGFGVSYSPSYSPTAWAAYDPGLDTPYPLQESAPARVVSSVVASDGNGGTYSKIFSYFGARTHAERGEFAGYQRIDEHDSRSSLSSRTFFEQTFPNARMVTKREFVTEISTAPVTRTVFTNSFATLDGSANNQRYFVYPSESTQTDYELGGAFNGALLRTVTTSSAYDNATGAIHDQTITTTESSGANGVTVGGTWVARTYIGPANILNDTTNWCIGRPQSVLQINSHNLTYGTSTQRRTNTTWDAIKCRPIQILEESGDAALQVVTDIGYDSFGNMNSTTVTGAGMTPRTTTAIYSDATYTTGQFPLSQKNPLNQTSTALWDYNLGVPQSSTDPNGLMTSWLYDPYGRRVRETRPDTTYTTWDFLACGGCDPRAKLFVDRFEHIAGGATFHRSMMYLDQFERSLYEYSLRPDNNYNITGRNFDALGRVATEKLPYSSATGAVGSVTTAYDVLGRPTTISRPISDTNPSLQTNTFYHEGLTSRIVDPQSKQSTQVTNAVGQLVRSADHDNYYQSFEYDAFGNPKRVQDSAGNTLQSSTYNLRGMLTQRADMDMGTWGFTPNALGETVSQTNAKGQTTTFAFDGLGRLTQRVEAEGTSTWTWGDSSGAKNIGRLASVWGPGYSESYGYDSWARPAQTTIYADATYDINYSYNSTGALDTLTYPTSTSSYRLKLQYEYQNGILNRIKDYNAPTTVFWAANAFNSRGQITQETLGNGLVTNRAFDGVTGWVKSIQTGAGGGTGVHNLSYEWDLVGNLKSRKDINQSYLIEEFFYDNLYRLDFSKRNGTINLDMAYSALGNILSKSDVGTYTYHATKQHQVTSTSNGWSFSYDANGNMETGRGATIAWTSYNYPASIANGADTSSFSYTPGRQYWKQISNYTSGGAATTSYVGGILEKVTTSAGTDFRHMIRAGGATIIVSRQSGGTNTTNYITTDHLGSSSAITNSSGGILVNSSFDAFGKRRGSNWTGTPSAGDWNAIAAATRRGYTDHTMLDNLGLIHMNGRVFDPMLGRFSSADPFIDGVSNTQGYNRYSLVKNNPLSSIDPSGFTEQSERDHETELHSWDRGEPLTNQSRGSLDAARWKEWSRYNPFARLSAWEALAFNCDNCVPPYSPPAMTYRSIDTSDPSVLSGRSELMHNEGRVSVGLPRSAYEETCILGCHGADVWAPTYRWATPDDDARAIAAFNKYSTAFSLPFAAAGLVNLALTPARVAGQGKIVWGSWQDYSKVTVGENTYAQVGSRLYSEHAVTRMQPSGMRYSGGGADGGSTGGMPQIRHAGGGYDYGRGVAPGYVEAAIATSRGVVQPNGNISHLSGSLEIILNPQGSVVTIITH